MTLLTDEQLAAIRERAHKATAGPWDQDSGIIPPDGPARFSEVYAHDDDLVIASVNDLFDKVEGDANRVFIASARTDIPALLSHAEAQEQRIKELENWKRQASMLMDAAQIQLRQRDMTNDEMRVAGCLRAFAELPPNYISQDADRIATLEAQLKAATDEISQAVKDVLAERQGQITREGWTPEHDDEHRNGEMATAAACYALGHAGWEGFTHSWPWGLEWWKPKDRRRNLVRAGALILAEIERIDRLPPQPIDDPIVDVADYLDGTSHGVRASEIGQPPKEQEKPDADLA